MNLTTSARFFLVAGALGGGLAVAAGAFGAHALRGRLPDSLLAVYHTASQYQMYHSLALLLVGFLIVRWPGYRSLTMSGWLLLAGMVLFSGSLYALALSGVRPLGMITPLGGALLLAGWGLLAVSLYRCSWEQTDD